MSENSMADTKVLQVCERYSAAFTEKLGILWFNWGPEGYPCFTKELLSDMLHGISTITDGSFEYAESLRYFVLRSDFPELFNLGGDLRLFYNLIQSKDRDGLCQYGEKALQLMHALSVGFERGVTTIALVQGKCLGGGFESALACDYIIAERQAEFGFPEIMLGIFPGMGAASMLARRVTKKVFEDLFHTGRTFSAHDLANIGIVDQVVEKGQGESAVISMIQKRHSAYFAHKTMTGVRKQAVHITKEEMLPVLDAWIDCALSLERRRLLILLQAAENQAVIG
jgi:DSF synthase